jgi:hypothetical protein
VKSFCTRKDTESGELMYGLEENICKLYIKYGVNIQKKISNLNSSMERKQSNFKISQGHFSKEDIHLNG